MEEKDKISILRNLPMLVEQTDFGAVCPKVMTKGVFPRESMDAFKAKPTYQEQNRELYLGIQKRGPQAFRFLVEALAESGHFDLAKQLDPTFDVQHHFHDMQSLRDEAMQQDEPMMPRSGRVVPTDLPVQLPFHNQDTPEEFIDNQEPITVLVKTAERYIGEPVYKSYKMMTKPKGFALIINNVEFINDCQEMREGAQVDGINMIALWTGLGYEVEYKENCGQIDFRNTVCNFAAKPEHSDVDSCVVVVMSHGSTEGITMADSKTVEYEWIVKQFNNAFCPRLQGKPKMFFFQACRGDTQDFGTSRRSSTSIDGRAEIAVMLQRGAIRIAQPVSPSIMNTYSEMFLARSSYPGYVSVRDHIRGSWFIEKICTVFMNMAYYMDLENMMKEVQERVAELTDDQGRRQTVVTENHGFTKMLFFNPGLYANPNLKA